MNIVENNELVNGDTIFYGIANNLSPIIAALISGIIVGLGALIAWKTYKNTRESTPPELLKLDKWTDSTKKIIEVEEKSGNRLLSSTIMNELKESINIYTQRALWESSLIKSGASKSIQRRLVNKYPSENLGKSVNDIVPGKFRYSVHISIIYLVIFIGTTIIMCEFLILLDSRIFKIKLFSDNIYDLHKKIVYSLGQENFPIIFLCMTFFVKILPYIYNYIFLRKYILSCIYYANARFSSSTYIDIDAIVSTKVTSGMLWTRFSLNLISVFFSIINDREEYAPKMSYSSRIRVGILILGYIIQFLLLNILFGLHETLKSGDEQKNILDTIEILVLVISFLIIFFLTMIEVWTIFNANIDTLSEEELNVLSLGNILSTDRFCYNFNNGILEVLIYSNDWHTHDDIIYLSHPLKYKHLYRICEGLPIYFRYGDYTCKFYFRDKRVHIGIKNCS